MSSLYLFFALCLVIQAATPDSYRITSLPYYTGTLSEMYSGFIDVKEGDSSKQLFFWFFVNQAQKQNSHFPVMLWLNGGPGSSSMDGLFMENGPFQVSENSSHQPVIIDMHHTWTKAAHMLYIDQPAGVGFSFVSDDSQLATSDTQAAQELHSVLKQFFAIFSTYKNNPFYLSGQSYAGKYIPFTASEILNDGNNEINLQGLIIGSGFMLGELQRIMMKNIAESVGLLQGNQLSQIDTLRIRCQQAYNEDPAIFLQQCNKILSFIEDMSLVDIENVLYLADSTQQPFAFYLNGNYSSKVLTSLHVTGSPKANKFERKSGAVAHAMARTKMASSIGLVQNLMTQNMPMLWYIGQFDGLDGIIGNQEMLKYIDWQNKAAFQEAPRWLYNTTEGNIAGYFKQVENFTWVILSKAGHYAAGDQRTNSLMMIQDYLTNGHQLSQNQGYNSPQMKMCEFMNYCSGHGSCTEGVCECEEGYYGQDCSYEVPDMEMHSSHELKWVNLKPKGWYFIKHEDNVSNFKHLVLSGKQSGKFTLYGFDEGDFKRGTLPDQQSYRFRLECLNYYVHFNKGDKTHLRRAQMVTQIIALYNPHISDPVDIEITRQTIYQTPVTETQSSVWSPPKFLFWVEMLIVVGTVVSIGFNIHQYSVLKKVNCHSYSVANVNSTIPPSIGTQFLNHGSLKSEEVAVNKSKSFL